MDFIENEDYLLHIYRANKVLGPEHCYASHTWLKSRGRAGLEPAPRAQSVGRNPIRPEWHQSVCVISILL